MKEYINHIVEKIASKEFNSRMESSVIKHIDRVQIRCPYCHEGKTKTKKRGNVYYNKLLYVCFRCDKKTTFDKFCRDFDESIDPDKKLEMIEYLDSVMDYSDYESDFLDTKLDDLINLADLENVFNNNLTNITDFSPIKENSGIYKYLLGRGIGPELHKDIYQAKYWRTEDQHEWVIVMLNRRGDKVLGMQVRNLKLGKRRMFKIYNYESLLELVNINNPDYDPEPSKLVLYNKLSYFFNILNVDMMSTITVFEGYIDSLFYKNSIGLVGVNTDMKFIENNDLDIQYFFDNDEAGYKKSEEKIKAGYRVFLWKKLFDDIVSKKKTPDPHQLLHRISKIKDINKLFELLPDAGSKLNLSDFFSLDAYDIRWVPKFRKKKIEDKDYNYKLGVYKL
jgi:DNA-directed RNA polymerase subunit RPC12/RpoP